VAARLYLPMCRAGTGRLVGQPSLAALTDTRSLWRPTDRTRVGGGDRYSRPRRAHFGDRTACRSEPLNLPIQWRSVSAVSYARRPPRLNGWGPPAWGACGLYGLKRARFKGCWAADSLKLCFAVRAARQRERAHGAERHSTSEERIELFASFFFYLRSDFLVLFSVVCLCVWCPPTPRLLARRTCPHRSFESIPGVWTRGDCSRRSRMCSATRLWLTARQG